MVKSHVTQIICSVLLSSSLFIVFNISLSFTTSLLHYHLAIMPLPRNVLFDASVEVTIEDGKVSVDDGRTAANLFKSSKILKTYVRKLAGTRAWVPIQNQDDPRVACFVGGASAFGERPTWMDSFMLYARRIRSDSRAQADDWYKAQQHLGKLVDRFFSVSKATDTPIQRLTVCLVLALFLMAPTRSQYLSNMVICLFHSCVKTHKSVSVNKQASICLSRCRCCQ